MLAGQRAKEVNSARMIEQQLGLGVADNFRHLAREFAVWDFQEAGCNVHVRILSWAPKPGQLTFHAESPLSFLRADRRRAPGTRLSVAPMRSNGKGNPFGHRLLQLQ